MKKIDFMNRNITREYIRLGNDAIFVWKEDVEKFLSNNKGIPLGYRGYEQRMSDAGDAILMSYSELVTACQRGGINLTTYLPPFEQGRLTTARMSWKRKYVDDLWNQGLKCSGGRADGNCR